MCRTLTFLILLTLPALSQSGEETPWGLTDPEWTRLSGEKKIRNRIKIYESASRRLFLTSQSAFRRQDHPQLLERLGNWRSLLQNSLSDIEDNLDGKKKTKELIRYEIHLRRAISDMTDWRYKLPEVPAEKLIAWLEHADRIHSKFVDILFQRP